MESLKGCIITLFQGIGGILVSLWDVLPDMLRLGVLIGTFVHIVIKIRKDLN
tara:strand:+ start:203 stop:358 length:156 start_codon:yes stop_codon:yes gene_type:complete